MKSLFGKTGWGIVAAALALFATSANAQLLQYFGPVNGVLVGASPSNPQTSAATISTIQGLLSTSPGVVLAGATGGAKGVGSINATALYINGAAVGTSSGAVSSVGLSVPGTATCLSTTGSPVTAAGTLGWVIGGNASQFLNGVGTCTNALTAVATTTALTLTGSGAGDELLAECNSTNSANLRCWSQRVGSGPNGAWTLQPELDNLTLGNAAMVVTRDVSANVTGIFFANATDNAPTTFQGTGLVTFNGRGVFNAPPSGIALSVTAASGAAAISATGQVNSVAPSAGSVGQVLVETPGGSNFGNVCISQTANVCETNIPANYLDLAGSTGVQMTVGGHPTLTATQAGNVSIPASTSGNSLLVNVLENNAIEFAGGNSTRGYNLQFFDTTNSAFRGFIGLGVSTITGMAATDFGITSGPGGSVVIGTANGASIGTRFGPSGNVTMAAASSGNTLAISGVNGQALAINGNAAGSNAMVITATNAASNSFGLAILAGTNGSDHGFQVINAAGTINYFNIFGDGGAVMGSPSGGDKGVGSFNAQSLYVNGVAVASGATSQTARWSGTCTSGGCTTGTSVGFNAPSRTSTGAYSLTFNPAFSANASCVGSVYSSGSGFVTVQSGFSTTSIQVYNAAGTLTDQGFSIVCIN